MEMTEVRTEIEATIKVTVSLHDKDSQVYQGFTTRKVELSLKETLESSAEIRAAFERLAEVAVHGASR